MCTFRCVGFSLRPTSESRCDRHPNSFIMHPGESVRVRNCTLAYKHTALALERYLCDFNRATNFTFTPHSRTENRVPSSNCALRVSGSVVLASRMIYSYDTPERAVAFDDSGCGYLDSGRDMCTTELQTGGVTSCLQLKSEPMGPSSPESTSELLLNGGPDDCAGCGRLIQVCMAGLKTLKKHSTLKPHPPMCGGFFGLFSRIDFTSLRWRSDGTPAVCSAVSAGNCWNARLHVSPGTATSTASPTTIGECVCVCV